MPEPEPKEPWTCPQCGQTWDLSDSEDRERAILNLVAHVLGIHENVAKPEK